MFLEIGLYGMPEAINLPMQRVREEVFWGFSVGLDMDPAPYAESAAYASYDDNFVLFIRLRQQPLQVLRLPHRRLCGPA